MGNSIVPSCVITVKVFHTPGLGSTPQPALLLMTFPGDAGIGESQLPVGFANDLHLPVIAPFFETLLAYYVQGGVKAEWIFWNFLPGVRVCNWVSFWGNDEFRMSRIRV